MTMHLKSRYLLAILTIVIVLVKTGHGLKLTDELKSDLIAKLREQDRARRYNEIASLNDLIDFQFDLLTKRNSACSSTNVNNLFHGSNSSEYVEFANSLENYSNSKNSSDVASKFDNLVSH